MSICNKILWRKPAVFLISRQFSIEPNRKYPSVILKDSDNIGIIKFNRPDKLNSLNFDMLQIIHRAIKEWKHKKLIIISSAGKKAFCAGTDLTEIANALSTGSEWYVNYFKEKARLQALISTIDVPIVTLSDGITMGSGLGIFLHGKYRVATENSVMAMPEVAIGAFPDSGWGFFSSSLQGKIGIYLALTGRSLKGGDLYKAGLSTHMGNSSQLMELENGIISQNCYNPVDLEDLLQIYHKKCSESTKPFTLESQMASINKNFSSNSLEIIIANLKTDGSEFSQNILKTFSKMSPSSLSVTARLFELQNGLPLKDCLLLEYRLMMRLLRMHDALEGVRAKLIEKDGNPKWNPPTLENVTPELINTYFLPVAKQIDLCFD